MTSQHAPRRGYQTGIVLFTTAVLLVGVVAIGLAALSMSREQLKLAGNQQFEAIAFNEAEAGVIAAEGWLSTGNNFGSAGFAARAAATPQLYPVGYLDGSSVARDPMRLSWDDTNSLSDGTLRRYLIERIATNKPLMGSSNDKRNVNIYRIIARGESARGGVRFVQTVYTVRCYDVENKKCPEYP